MADAVTSQTLIDGDRNAVMKFTNISDATGESAVTKVTISSLAKRSSDGKAVSGVKIDAVDFYTDGMGVDILWDATTPLIAVTLPKNQRGQPSFEKMGGLINNAGAGKTGNIKFTTVGAALNSRYTVILHLKKEF